MKIYVTQQYEGDMSWELFESPIDDDCGHPAEEIDLPEELYDEYLVLNKKMYALQRKITEAYLKNTGVQCNLATRLALNQKIRGSSPCAPFKGGFMGKKYKNTNEYHMTWEECSMYFVDTKPSIAYNGAVMSRKVRLTDEQYQKYLEWIKLSEEVQEFFGEA